MKLLVINHKFHYEMEKLVRIFMPDEKIKQKELVDYLGVSKGYISLVISGQRSLSDENLRKLINNPFGWDTSILLGAENENSENQPENPMTEQPEEKRMIDTLLFLVESQKKDIETLIRAMTEFYSSSIRRVSDGNYELM